MAKQENYGQDHLSKSGVQKDEQNGSTKWFIKGESFPYCVPNLKFDGFCINLNRSSSELDTDGLNGSKGKGNTRSAKKNEFQKGKQPNHGWAENACR